MPLTRAQERYTYRVDGVHFLMRDGPIEVICRITVEALSRLGQALGLSEPNEIFEAGRDPIERAARNKYDRTRRRPYEVLIITADDLSLDGA